MELGPFFLGQTYSLWWWSQVAAAGNFLQATCNYSPARAPSVIAVGSSNIVNHMSWFSNYGNCTTIFAPVSHTLAPVPRRIYKPGPAKMASIALVWCGMNNRCPIYLLFCNSGYVRPIASSLKVVVKAYMNRFERNRHLAFWLCARTLTSNSKFT